MDFIDSWSNWVQDVGKAVITSRAQAEYQAPIELEKMRLQAYGPFGQSYIEGRANPALIGGQILPGVSNLVLLVGAVALVLVLKD